MSDAFESPKLGPSVPNAVPTVAGGEATRQEPVRSLARQLKMFVEPADGLRDGLDLDLAPLDATFRDSSEAPLHSWFPYLEGYSPRFVERVRYEYLASAKRIIEPFAGSGTTPIVLGQQGIECAFSEANPAMAFIAMTKLAVLRLTPEQKHELAQRLVSLACELPDRVTSAPKDTELQTAYSATFGKSVFFDKPALDAVLRLRTINDQLSGDDSLLGDCLALAVLYSLIPASRLKRAGDLRYRTAKELTARLPRPVAIVCSRLVTQASDLSKTERLSAGVRFACATADLLHEHLDGEWDGVITSPPYLNGTNYIRNARLELWYLRHLKEKGDLRRLRDGVITSGINDVSARTTWEPVTEGVERVVRALQQSAYDSRIAKMVGGYFHDSASVLTSLRACLRPGGRLCIDIGDSFYNGVHVRTDDLLVEVAESHGFRTVERVYLRQRISKGGELVRQQLLVFERPRALPRLRSTPSSIEIGQTSGVGTRSALDWRTAWSLFKRDLPHQRQPYAKREWGGPAHSMCSYQGKMKPALAHHLVTCFSSQGDVVVDPFAGAGTIPLEACRTGRRGFGIDISRLGHVLTSAKVSQPSPSKLEHLLGELESAITKYEMQPQDVERAAAVRFNGAIPEFFHPKTLREVLAARSFFLSRWNSGPEWAVMFACTLHLLHGNRPYSLSRRSHPVTPFKPTGAFEYRALLPRLVDKVARLHEHLVDRSRACGSSVQADCTTPWPTSIPKADVIITSPPFFDSTRFYMTNWMRYWFAGWEREDFEKYAGDFLETRQKQNLDVYKLFFESARERTHDNGLVVLHLGHSAKCDMGVELSKRIAPWFSLVDVFTEGVEHCESHGIRDKGTVKGHTYVILSSN